MKGRNLITINQATMAEAIEFWLSSQFTEDKAPIVQEVVATANDDRTFIIYIEPKPKEGNLCGT